MKNKTANNILAALRKFLNSFVKGRCRTLRFRSDGGDEFMKAFGRYCEEHGTNVWKFQATPGIEPKGAMETSKQGLVSSMWKLNTRVMFS